jgi:hypothetical protein
LLSILIKTEDLTDSITMELCKKEFCSTCETIMFGTFALKNVKTERGLKIRPYLRKNIISFLQEEDTGTYRHINNFNTHSCVLFPSRKEECPCHCSHLTCDVCCYSTLPEELKITFAFQMNRNHEKLKEEEEKERQRERQRKKDEKELRRLVSRAAKAEKAARARGKVAPSLRSPKTKRGKGKGKAGRGGKKSKAIRDSFRDSPSDYP